MANDPLEVQNQVTDPQQALSMLRRTRQKHTEGVQVYAERMLALAEDAWPDRTTDKLVQCQLVDIFVDGLTSDTIARKLMRQQPETICCCKTSSYGTKFRYEV